MSIHHDLLKLISLYLQTLIDQHLHIWKKEEFFITNLTNLQQLLDIVIPMRLRRKYQF